MNRKIFDFELYDNDYKRIIMRFYPKGTSVHGFENDNVPMAWSEVYKVYYSWAILVQYKDWDGSIDCTKRLFYMHCDECSEFPNLPSIIKSILNKEIDLYDYPVFSDGADWEIERSKDNNYLLFKVFDSITNTGYRFILNDTQVDKFINWLEFINDYALRKCAYPI